MRTSILQKIANAIGTIINPATEEKQDDIISAISSIIQTDYKISDMDTSSDPSYFGYIDKDGNWYITELTESTGEVRYCKGSSDYSTNWTSRASLTYDLYNNVF